MMGFKLIIGLFFLLGNARFCLQECGMRLVEGALRDDEEDGVIVNRRLFTPADIRSFNLKTQGEYCRGDLASKYPFSCKQQKRVLVIPQNYPVPTLHGSDKRCFHVLEALRALDHRVAVVPFMRTYYKPGEEDNELLRQLKVEFYPTNLVQHKKNTSDNYKKILDEFKPDVVITWLWFWEMRQTAPSVITPLTRAEAPNIKVIVFTDDVHSKREKQIAEQFKNFHAFDHYVKRSKKMMIQEIAAYRQCDVVVAISNADRAEIATMDGVSPTEKVMHMRYVASPWENNLVTRLPSGSPPFSKRRNLVFVGNGENPTNIHAMKWFLESLAKEFVKGIPGVRLTVIGQAWDAFKENEAESAKYMDFLGPLSTQAMNAAIDQSLVFISPVRASTGINTKNVLALNRGIPLVTTPAGAVGMCAKCDNAVLVNPIDPFAADEPDSIVDMPLLMGRDIYDFVAQVKSVYYDETKWKLYSEAGAKHIQSWFGLPEAAGEVDLILERAFNPAVAHVSA